jgi:hypothetical protein
MKDKIEAFPSAPWSIWGGVSFGQTSCSVRSLSAVHPQVPAVLVPSGSWRVAAVVSVLKSGKEDSLPTSYQSVGLTSCVCKTTECFVNHRLFWLLDNKSTYECSLWVSVLQIYPWPPCEPRALLIYPKLFPHVPTPCCSLLQLGKGIWHDLVIWYRQDPWSVESLWLATTISFELSPWLSLLCFFQQYLLCCLSPRKLSTKKISFKCGPVCSSHQWDG